MELYKINKETAITLDGVMVVGEYFEEDKKFLSFNDKYGHYSYHEPDEESQFLENTIQRQFIEVETSRDKSKRTWFRRNYVVEIKNNENNDGTVIKLRGEGKYHYIYVTNSLEDMFKKMNSRHL